ncbi:MAG: transketolase family protein [Anaerolineae bacterium]|jgi:transketolase|nr:transketolase family protein [Anaerolineae bacterium]
MSELQDCRKAFVNALEILARNDPRIVTLSNDSISSASLSHFAEVFPGRAFNVGIAEQNMVGMASGMANGGKIPFVAAAACFLTGRALEQIKTDVAYTGTNVKLCGVSPGLAYGPLGGTHHSIEDIAWLRAIANMTIIVPADSLETEQAVQAAANFVGPVYLRISRMGVPVVHNADYRFEIGKAVRLRDGNDVTLVACGTLVPRALEAAVLLESDGIQARVINMATVKPIDREAIIAAAVETGGIVTAEEHTIYGGFGSAIAEVVVTTHPVPMRILGIPGVFAPTGSTEFLFNYFGLTPQGIHDAAFELVKSRGLQ